jgi:hypothetical protein
MNIGNKPGIWRKSNMRVVPHAQADLPPHNMATDTPEPFPREPVLPDSPSPPAKKVPQVKTLVLT